LARIIGSFWLFQIISCLYGHNAELIVDISNEECYLFLNGIHQVDMQIDFAEVDCLVYNDIIELDSGCDEPGHEEKNYVLTDIARRKIKEIIKNPKTLLLKE